MTTHPLLIFLRGQGKTIFRAEDNASPNLTGLHCYYGTGQGCGDAPGDSYGNSLWAAGFGDGWGDENPFGEWTDPLFCFEVTARGLT